MVIEYIGYAASLLVLLSLMMKSLVRLRIINLFGCCLFSVYGLMIGAIPVVLLNIAMLITNIYFLFIKKQREELNIELTAINAQELLQLHMYTKYVHEIQYFFGDYDLKKCNVIYLILNGHEIAGILAGTQNDTLFTIVVDFVFPKFRNYKIGKVLYHKNPALLKSKGVHTVLIHSENKEHQKYITHMNFQMKADNNFFLELH